MNDMELYDRVCNILTDFETENKYDINEWYEILVKIQNRICEQEVK